MIVPVGNAHVGCKVALATGAAGAPGTGFTVNTPPVLVQVLSDVLLTVTV